MTYEEKEKVQTDLNRRNTESVILTIADMNARIYEQAIRIDGLNNSIHVLQSRITELENLTILQKVKLTGHGPSVK